LKISAVHGVNSSNLAVHPSGDYCAYGAGAHVVLWAWGADRRLPLNSGGGTVSCVTFTPDGVYAMCGTSAPNAMVTVFDIAAASPCFHAVATHRMSTSSSITHLACSADSRLLAAIETTEGGFAHLYVWDWSRSFALRNSSLFLGCFLCMLC
jgi:WD40 repeat protein